MKYIRPVTFVILGFTLIVCWAYGNIGDTLVEVFIMIAALTLITEGSAQIHQIRMTRDRDERLF
jgi:hypothetical protein